MADEDCIWDFFVSYTQADRPWAEWIAWILEEDGGYRAKLQAWDSVPGTNWNQHMQDGIVHAARTIAVLSDDYFTSESCASEWMAVWSRDQRGAQRKLIPISVAECDPLGLLSPVVRIDLFGCSEAQATARLLEGVEAATSGRAKPTSRPEFPGAPRAIPTAVRFPGTPSSTWRGVPAHTHYFTGRDDKLTEMKAHLTAHSAVSVHTVCGLGGVGKTRLATEYAHRFANDYDRVWWIDAEISATIPEQFAGLATDLGLGRTHSPGELRHAVHDALRTAGGWLLIFDNAESVDAIEWWLPGGPVPAGAPGHVIVTTRCTGFGALGPVLELDVIGMNDAVRWLQARVPDLDDRLAESIADALGCLPLGLQDAAAYLECTQTSPRELLHQLITRQSPLWAGAGNRGHRSLATVWELSLDWIRDEDAAGLQILDVCAYLAAEPIPLDLFKSHPDDLPQPLRTAAESTVLFTHAVATIVGCSMARRSPSGHMQLHRLVQEALQTRHPKLAEKHEKLSGPAASTTEEPATSPAAQQHPLATALALLCATAPADTDDPQNWPRWAELLPHVLETVGAVDSTAGADVVKNASWLRDRAHRYLQIRLEDISGEHSVNWVRERNEATRAELCDSRFEELRCEALEILEADTRIPYVGRFGEYLYNFWRDAIHKRGVWRRTTLASYRTDDPDWEVLIDVDTLPDADRENWAWAGCHVLEPDLTLALIWLSRGGADAAVVREFDMTTKQFVPNGFELSREAKSDVSWQGRDSVLVGTDFGPGSLTDSGRPRIIKRWLRGQQLKQATTLFTGEPSDFGVAAGYDPTPGFERLFIYRALDIYHRERYELRGEERVRIDVPTDARMSIHREWMLIRPRTPWAVGNRTYPAGSLLAANYDEFLTGTTEISVVFEPDDHSSLMSCAWTRDRLILVTLRDVASHVEIATPGTWERQPIDGLPPNTTTKLVDVDEYGDEIFLDSSGFDTPSQLLCGHAGDEMTPIKSAQDFFDAHDIAVAQHFVASDDGTMIPYFIVGHQNSSGPAPTLLEGYGGFGHSMLPGYSGILGQWLSLGGTYVLANIRGGGEYGPRWHTQAMRENRHKVYEDFASVARDLVKRGITTAGQLSALGDSTNGGLLIGVMLTRYPGLFGALVCSAPVLDLKRFHLLLDGRLWVEEYGDPDNPDDWAYMAEFSPYQNISADAHYPPLLMTTSMHERVHPAHARKMALALEADGHPVYYYENIEGDHPGAANKEQAAFRYALEYSFLWRMLGGPTP